MGSSTSPPKPLRPIPLRERVRLQGLHKGVIGHFHDHDDDYLLERGRSRRKREPKPEEDPDRIDWTAVWEEFLKTLPPPPPRSGDLCILSLRDEAPEEPA